MSIFINSKQRRDEYNQITQLQNQINQFLTDPNIDDAVKSEARKQLNELSTNISQQNMRKGVARQYTIDTLNSIVQSLTPAEEGYQPSYITPSEGFKYIEQFDPKYKTDSYQIDGVEPNLQERVNKFSAFLIQELQKAKPILDDSGKVLYGWNPDIQSSTIDQWISKLQEKTYDDTTAKNKLSFIGNTIINGIANEKLVEIFENQFSPWMEGSEQAKEAEAKLAAQERTAPVALSGYDSLLNKGYTFAQDENGNYIAATQDDAGNWVVADQTGDINLDFTSDNYMSGWVIGENGKVILIDDFRDINTNKDYVNLTGWQTAIQNAKDALQSKYPSVFNFSEGLDSDNPRRGLNVDKHKGKTFIDLSYYFPGQGYVLGVQKQDDADNFSGYNWGDSDREFYVSTDGSEWHYVKGIEQVKQKLGLNQGFIFQGADIEADKNKENKSQYETNFPVYDKPSDWDTIDDSEQLSFLETPLFNDQEGKGNWSNLIDMVDLLFPYENDNELNEAYKRAGSRKYDGKSDVEIIGHYKSILGNMTKDSTEAKGLYKAIIKKLFQLKTHPRIFSRGRLVTQQEIDKWIYAMLYRYQNADKPFGYTFEKESQAIASQKQGGVLKLSIGGEAWFIGEVKNPTAFAENTELQQNAEDTYYVDLANRAEQSGRSLEDQKRGETQMSLIDAIKTDRGTQLRLGALAADLAALITSFAPGGGTMAAGAAGVTSLILDGAADIVDGESAGQIAKNAAQNLLFGIVGLIPGGKAWQITKRLATWGTALSQAALITPTVANKLKSGEQLSLDELKQVQRSLSTLLNASTVSKTHYNLAKMKKRGSIDTGNRTIKGDKGQEFKISKEELAEIDRVGKTKGHDAAVAKVREVLLKSGKYKKEDVDKAIFEFEYRQGSDSGNFFTSHFYGKAKKSIKSVATPEYKENATWAEFYKDNPYRRGNPNNDKHWKEGAFKTNRLTAPDYVLYNYPEIRKFNVQVKDWPRLSKFFDSGKTFFTDFFGNIRKTDAWSAKYNALKEIELNGVKKKILVPKEVELTKKKITTKDNKEIEVEVRLKKLTDSNENEWVDVDNKKDVYIKQSDGTFVKKVEVTANTDTNVQAPVSPTPAPPVQTSNSSSIASDGTIQRSPKSSKHTNNNANNKKKKKKGKKHDLGGKLDRLTNYLNSK